MASTYNYLGIELMATGENAGTWGTKTNTNLNIIQQAASGYHSQSIAGGVQTTALLITDGDDTSSMIVPVSLTGLSMTSTIGSPVITSNPGVQPTGISATSTVGSVDITIGELLPAQSLTSTVGSLTVATATIITMPGFELPITLNLPSSTAYKDIVIDGNTSYTDVDITGNTSYTDVKHVNQA